MHDTTGHNLPHASRISLVKYASIVDCRRRFRLTLWGVVVDGDGDGSITSTIIEVLFESLDCLLSSGHALRRGSGGVDSVGDSVHVAIGRGRLFLEHGLPTFCYSHF